MAIATKRSGELERFQILAQQIEFQSKIQNYLAPSEIEVVCNES